MTEVEQRYEDSLEGGGTKRRFGLDFPASQPEHLIHLHLWARWRDEPYAHANFLKPISEHFLIACRMLFSEKQLVINPWFERMAEAHTMNRVCLFWGAASAGKSHFAGLATLLRFISAPDETYACMASTSKGMLLLRSMASAIEYLGHLKANGFEVPLKYVSQFTAIVPVSTSEAPMDQQKAMIKGVAVREGSADDARASLGGVHLPRIVSVCDEFEAMGDRAKAFKEAQSNLMVTQDYVALYLFNPTSLYSPGCAMSVPKNGWGSVDITTADEWETAAGHKVLRFDAYKSPGRINAKKYYFLPNDETIKAVVDQNNGNEDAPAVWTYLRGCPPPQSAERTVLSETMVRAYNMSEPVQFVSRATRIGACDPAFTSGGDNAVFVVADVGHFVTGQLGICFRGVHYLDIKASSDKPVTEQLVDQICQLLLEEELDPMNFGCDDSGVQSIADSVTTRLRRQICRFNFSMKPPEIPVSAANSQTCDKKYRNTATYLWFLVKEFGENNQIRGLPQEAASQFCKRRIDTKSQPHALESKQLMAKRISGRSPDEADACAMACGVARQVCGLVPGATEWATQGQAQTIGWFSQEEINRYNNMELART